MELVRVSTTDSKCPQNLLAGLEGGRLPMKYLDRLSAMVRTTSRRTR